MKSNIKEETIKILEEKGRKTKSKLWKDIANRLRKPSRQKPSVNLWKLEKLGAKNKDKYLLVYGKILGKGELENPVNVIYNEISDKAKEKIEEKGGKAIYLRDALELKKDKIVIVK